MVEKNNESNNNNYEEIKNAILFIREKPLPLIGIILYFSIGKEKILEISYWYGGINLYDKLKEILKL